MGEEKTKNKYFEVLLLFQIDKTPKGSVHIRHPSRKGGGEGVNELWWLLLGRLLFFGIE
jgi:hypothetical protein